MIENVGDPVVYHYDPAYPLAGRNEHTHVYLRNEFGRKTVCIEYDPLQHFFVVAIHPILKKPDGSPQYGLFAKQDINFPPGYKVNVNRYDMWVSAVVGEMHHKTKKSSVCINNMYYDFHVHKTYPSTLQDVTSSPAIDENDHTRITTYRTYLGCVNHRSTNPHIVVNSAGGVEFTGYPIKKGCEVYLDYGMSYFGPAGIDKTNTPHDMDCQLTEEQLAAAIEHPNPDDIIDLRLYKHVSGVDTLIV